MKKIPLFVVIGALLAVFIPLTAAPAEAQAPPPWQVAGWNGVGATVTTFSLTGPATLHVTDYQCVGDAFTVFVDGTSVGNTTAPSQNCDINADTPDQACADGRFGGGSFTIADGDHSIEIRHLSGFGNGDVAYRTGTVGCNNLQTDGPFLGMAALCIEDDFVQANAVGHRVGDIIAGGPDRVLIATGPPTCNFNCIDGFDINCDGKIGDFCPAELDRSLVENVQPCLDAANPSVPVVAAAAPTEAPAAIAVQDSTLAYTGAETQVLGMIGAAMLCAGALAVGSTRRRGSDQTLNVDRWLD